VTSPRTFIDVNGDLGTGENGELNVKLGDFNCRYMVGGYDDHSRNFRHVSVSKTIECLARQLKSRRENMPISGVLGASIFGVDFST